MPHTGPYGWWRFGAAGGGFAVLQGTTSYMHPSIGIALAITDISVPLAAAVVLVVAILSGSDQTCERVFRLLRWIANRPEPSAPEHPARQQS